MWEKGEGVREKKERVKPRRSLTEASTADDLCGDKLVEIHPTALQFASSN